MCWTQLWKAAHFSGCAEGKIFPTAKGWHANWIRTIQPAVTMVQAQRMHSKPDTWHNAVAGDVCSPVFCDGWPHCLLTPWVWERRMAHILKTAASHALVHRPGDSYKHCPWTTPLNSNIIVWGTNHGDQNPHLGQVCHKVIFKSTKKTKSFL